MTEPPIAQNDPPEGISGTRAAGRPSNAGRLLHNRPAMLALLFFVTGFLGLPFLWKSRAFSANEKIVWSIVVTIYTCLLLLATAAIVWWSYSTIRDTFGW